MCNWGNRHTRAGFVPQRGDIWNPFSFNEVLTPLSEINFLTASGGFRTPYGWTFGSRVYHDFSTGETPEWDVVGLFQNDCRCWSLGLYYIRLGGGDGLPERNQFNFVLTLRGNWRNSRSGNTDPSDNFGAVAGRGAGSSLGLLRLNRV